MIGNGIGIGFQLKKKVLVFDSFTRADSATSLGKANTGQTWSALSGTWGIISNQAYLASVISAAVAVVNALIPDVSLTCSVTLSPTLNRANAGLILRCIDDNNYILIAIAKAGTGTADAIEIYKRDAGTFTALASLSNAGNINGTTYEFKVITNGNQISVYRDGVLKVSHTLSGADATKYSTPTRYGLRESVGAGNDDGNSRFDQFAVVSL